MVMEQEVFVVYILFNTVFFLEQNHCLLRGVLKRL